MHVFAAPLYLSSRQLASFGQMTSSPWEIFQQLDVQLSHQLLIIVLLMNAA